MTRKASQLHHPVRTVTIGFASAVAVGTGLLHLPAARTGPGSATLMEALFTATSAVCVTGLTVVDTASHWSTFGEVVILLLIMAGGMGIMTVASLLGMLVSRRMGLRSRLIAATETKALSLGDVRRVLLGVLRVSLIIEAVTAVILALRWWLAYDLPWTRAAYHGVFHAVSAFNNAGFALSRDSLVPFAGDPWICLPISASVVLGGLGFPVLFELWRRQGRPRAWSLHTKLTMATTAVLLPAGTLFILAVEWGNPATLGPMDTPGRILAAFVQGGVMPRTAGFNTLDISALNESTWLAMDVLMFIGGGPAGTAGGIKVTTFTLLLFVIMAEVRGDPDATLFDRRVSERAQRQAMAVTLLGLIAVVGSALVLEPLSGLPSAKVLFEVTSAFGTVGLSTGITPDLPPAGQLILVMLMFLGRVGPATLITALALRDHPRHYRLPEGRPIIG